MTRRATLAALGAGALALALPGRLPAQSAPPLRITITEGVVAPMPFAVAGFVPVSGAAGEAVGRIAGLVAADLAGTGLFREIDPALHRGLVTSFEAPVDHGRWRGLGVQALVTGAVAVEGGRARVGFRLWDVVTGQEVGQGLQFTGSTEAWRRLAHKVADAVYSRITGEGGYFDSRVVFVAESGPKSARRKRLALMDQDGANLTYLTDASALVLSPRFSPAGDRVLYVSYERGFPRVLVMDLASGSRRAVADQPGTMTFAPRFGPDGHTILFALEQGGNSEVVSLDLASGGRTRLTEHPAIDTAPAFAPDGAAVVFESDRSGAQQLYVIAAGGGEPRRISFGEGRYATPVWSPRGDLVAFTKQHAGRFHIGVMKVDGSGERLLTASFLEEGPSFAPNGRVIMFTRETAGEGGAPGLFTVDISGRNLRQVPTETFASDASWGPLLA
ncbi:MAG: Tol-Pal system protein TolB [Rhodobacteraceae bacterium]|nr:Tol-Pal system protein TolB [Paracoccaceae bacterium]